MNDTDSPLPAAANLPDAQTVAHVAVDAASDKKAQDIVLLDVRKVTTLADYFLICTATSERQMRAVADGIEEALDRHAVTPLHREAETRGRVDGARLRRHCGTHIRARAAAYYRLENLGDRHDSGQGAVGSGVGEGRTGLPIGARSQTNPGKNGVEHGLRDDARPFAVGLVVGIGGGLVLGSVVVGLFGSDLWSALRHLVHLIRQSDDDDHVDFELLLQ